MWRVRLVNANGDFVAHVLVPPFVKMPEVIIWGVRYFQLCDDKAYHEVCAVVGWTEQELEQRGRAVMNEGAIIDYV